MKLQLRIKRQDPERSAAPYWAEYEVEVEPTDRLLDALHKVKWYQDGTLAFRRSCGHGLTSPGHSLKPASQNAPPQRLTRPSKGYRPPDGTGRNR